MCLFQSLERLLITIPQHPGNSAGVHKVYKIQKLIHTFVSKCLDYLWALRTSLSIPSFLNYAKCFCSFRSESSRTINKHLMSTESLQHLQDLLSSRETPEPANFTPFLTTTTVTGSSSHFSVFYTSSPGRWISLLFFFPLSILIQLLSTQTRSDKTTPSSTVPSAPTTRLISEAALLNTAGKKTCLCKGSF